MNRKRIFPLFLTLFMATGCGSSNGNKSFYDKVDREFGVVSNVAPYTVKDTKTINDTEYFKWHGRHYKDNGLNAEFFSWSNAGFEVTFVGTTLEAHLYTTNADRDKDRPYIAVSIDNDYDPSHATPIQLTSLDHSNAEGRTGGYFSHPHVVLAHGLENKEHTVRIYKRSEINNSKVAIKSISTDGTLLPVKAKQLDLKMEFYGDSVTCGYAVESPDFYENFSTRCENSMKSFANFAANYLNADASLISCGGYPIYKSEYAKGEPDNIPAMFSRADNDWNVTKPIAWDNNLYIPDVVVIALGANDGSYLAKFKKDTTAYNMALNKYKSKYIEFLDTIFQAYPSTQVVVSDEVIPIQQVYADIMDQIVSEYNEQHSLTHPLMRVKYDSYERSKDKTMPGAGHPNETMQHIAGKELAEALSERLKLTMHDDGFTY